MNNQGLPHARDNNDRFERPNPADVRQIFHNTVGEFDRGHGVLRDEEGEPRRYRVLDPAGRPNIPLVEAAIWDDEMSDAGAEFFAEKLEFTISLAIGAVSCVGSHDVWRLTGGPCTWCKAVL